MVINAVPYEDDEHICLVRVWKLKYPHIPLIHIANGELRDSNRQRAMIRGAKLKRMGVKKGVWDLFFPTIFTWVEVKRQKGGRLSPEQKLFREQLEPIGYGFIVANGWQDGMEKLEELLKGDIPCILK